MKFNIFKHPFVIKFDCEIANPIGIWLRRRRLKKVAKLWNGEVEIINEYYKDYPENSDWTFKWNQLVSQEIIMWINLAEKVSLKDFEEICNRRGFDHYMREFLIECLNATGLKGDW